LRAASPIRGKRLIQWLRRVTLVLVSAGIMLCIVGGLYQAVATGLDKRRFPPPGRLVDIGGYRLHIYCTGSGSPAVILESGLGGGALIWPRIQPEIAKVSQVCAYDRGGSGWSGLGPGPRDAEQIARELHALLEGAGIPEPYVLVGHSYGGLYVRVFSAQYPESVAGLVLLEASHPDQYTRTPASEAEYQRLAQIYEFIPFAARLGLFRFGPFCRLPDDFPAQSVAEFHALCSASAGWDAQRAEVEAIPATMSQVRAAGSLGDLPLAVVSAGGHGQANPLWAEYQDELAGLSTNSMHIVVDGAGHTTLWTDPEDARASVQAILDVIDAVRSGQPLASGQY
jgi:pimeloyl-ACP methyl ester carboxylesterase